jgi:two-component system phosphate regulon response regulator PhoB
MESNFSKKNNKILVIDNEPYILLIIEEKLKSAGLDIILLRESKNAVQVAKQEMPDLIILDWMMPDVSGIEICNMLKSDNVTSHIPIFMLTGKCDAAEKQLGLQCGVEKYITKPFSPRLLLEWVQKAIERQ